MSEQNAGKLPEDEQEWVTTGEAGRILELRRDEARVQMLNKGLTARRTGKPPASLWWLREEVERLASERWRTRPLPRYPGRARTLPPEMGEDKALIGTREAAALLGVTPDALRDMAERGRLTRYQRLAGRHGSRLQFDRAEVEALAEEDRRKAHQEAYRQGEATKRRRRERAETAPELPMPQWMLEIAYPLETWYGDWMTTRQAAEHLKVSKSRVRALRRSGKLMGYLLPRNFGTKRPFCFRRKDVERLANDAGYRAARARYDALHTPEEMEKREAARLLEQAEWTLRVNGWKNGARHMGESFGWPGDIW